MQKVTGESVLRFLLVVIIFGLPTYELYLYNNTIQKLYAVTNELNQTRDDLRGRISSLESSVGSQVGKVEASVGTLEKLSQTDPELLKQYSKVYFLNEHYVPAALSPIDPQFVLANGQQLFIHSNVAPFLEKLLSDAESNQFGLRVVSAYRSFGQQSMLKKNYKFIYGAGTANQFSADQGYSEHQLGTAVDFGVAQNKNQFTGFENTPEYSWLVANAYKYGFVISYPPHNSYYVYEPWHWRFVGLSLALYLHNNNLYFYNIDQRKAESYLGSIFDSSASSKPAMANF